MKKYFNPIKLHQLSPLSLLMALFFIFTSSGFSQGDSGSTKLPITLNLSYKITNGIKSVKAEVSRKENGKSVPVENVIINLYLDEIKNFDPSTNNGLMANKVTNEDGEAIFTFTNHFNQLTANRHVFNFTATINSDLKYEDQQEDIIVNEAVINLSFNTEDKITTVSAKLTKFQDSTAIATPEAEVKMLIKRTFGMLPYGEEGVTTDENGELAAELPADIAGNADKTITVVAKYEDEENGGTIEVSKNIPWSILPKQNHLAGRTLWSTGNNAPLPLVIASISIISLIWGIIFYLIYLLYKIKKLSFTP